MTKDDWKGKYLYLNKIIINKCNTLLTKQQKLSKLLTLIGTEHSLYYQLSLKYLKLQIIVSLLNNNKSSHDILDSLFIELLKTSTLKDKLPYEFNQIKAYGVIIKREKIWSDLTGVITENIGV